MTNIIIILLRNHQNLNPLFFIQTIGPICPFPTHNHPTQSGGSSNSQSSMQQTRPTPSSMNQGTQKPRPQTHPTRPPHAPVTQQVTTYPILPHTHSPQQQTQRPQGKTKIVK